MMVRSLPNKAAKYDAIGIDYAQLRKPDPRLARPLHEALGAARSVLNVGAGTGSYEPEDRDVMALEPSARMIAQRSPHAAPVVRGVVEQLPFADKSFDAGLAILTVHHWRCKSRGLSELRRVIRDRVVILTFDGTHEGTWLTDYLPALRELDEAQMPPMAMYEQVLGPVDIYPVPIPQDCTDGFLYAYWKRPHAYLDARIRAGSSSFWALDDVGPGLARLEADLKSRDWHARYGALLDTREIDAGYRLVVTR